MNVTSMLSSGYLQPFGHPLRSVEEDRESSALSAQEQYVLAQEQALKAVSGPDSKVSTTYRYSIGADGRRYITGAYVSIESNAQSNEASSGSVQLSNDVERKNESPDAKTGKNEKLSTGETEAAVRELKRIEQEVISHEAAHQAAGGSLTGAATYTYTQGPDGRNYITASIYPLITERRYGRQTKG